LVAVAEKRARPAVAPLPDMVQMAGNDEAGEASHAASWPQRDIVSIECTVTAITLILQLL